MNTDLCRYSYLQVNKILPKAVSVISLIIFFLNSILKYLLLLMLGVCSLFLHLFFVCYPHNY